ncbi:conserved hypothetical protein [Trichinella spiralis]|uniref:hypothetical protein n=1 Tax=Trichinella spiralis TaxID=6334 RepID=UPI0001EFBA05|nr:conserved hypothetical protein [Trichinella spiralis]
MSTLKTKLWPNDDTQCGQPNCSSCVSTTKINCKKIPSTKFPTAEVSFLARSNFCQSLLVGSDVLQWGQRSKKLLEQETTKKKEEKVEELGGGAKGASKGEAPPTSPACLAPRSVVVKRLARPIFTSQTHCQSVCSAPVSNN